MMQEIEIDGLSQRSRPGGQPMPNDKLAEIAARAICPSPEICPACMAEAHGVIAAIRAAGYAILATEGPEFEASVERAVRAENMATCDDPECCDWPEPDDFDRRVVGAALRAALTQPNGACDAD